MECQRAWKKLHEVLEQRLLCGGYRIKRPTEGNFGILSKQGDQDHDLRSRQVCCNFSSVDMACRAGLRARAGCDRRRFQGRPASPLRREEAIRIHSAGVLAGMISLTTIYWCGRRGKKMV